MRHCTVPLKNQFPDRCCFSRLHGTAHTTTVYKQQCYYLPGVQQGNYGAGHFLSSQTSKEAEKSGIRRASGRTASADRASCAETRWRLSVPVKILAAVFPTSWSVLMECDEKDSK
ncbi:hypothetical protein AAFF_G00270020 [Aldrovandia affinis]|uniref:Uncharacterized protein n=1 Tax=Aldrovandia affinis TaxID=143900 RepID=A0AAD7STM1_9TELE|nr:hypothetical protein AAFF_G00270020 [Aldrovandia affinis]